ncbi:lipoprotein-releasing system permease protein [Arcticibacter tournemirensis]|uniref:ABC transporter permease n=1 Tax=Arcticibacter tournemirensis TaxID=699437 RepID=A0A4Q0M9A1_9SPHI|nr:FtsX-like permease family protein [Arcticibacter tournemirensis]KAA8484411.1 ABC transporter permease [Arcticibacter tournemirensis]RXF69778.1 ABC transporter permease [Arcticibacter tournemirensis]TQM49853.1 lipoprotein-releasing system permease protein [Arcticibacter tournemirensis]
MNLSAFIAKRITLKSQRTFSKLSVRIAIAGIMLSLAVMILSVAVMRGFKSEIREKARGFSGDIIVMKYDLNASYENSPFSVGADTIAKLARLPGITYAQPYALKPGIINANNEIEGVVLKGVDKNYHWDYFKRIMVAGKVIDFTDSLKARTQVIISKYIADRLHLKTGDDFLMYFVQEPLRKRKFVISGIYDLGVEEVDKTYVLGDLSLIRRLNNWKDNEVGGYELRVDDFSKLDETATNVYYELPVKLKSWSVKEYYPAIFQWLSLLDVNTQVILVLMLAVAIINMVSALLIIILERTSMIGILKALGSTNWMIQKIFLTNAFYLIGFGMVLGNVLGIGLGLFQTHTHFFQLDQASYYVSFVPVELNITDILLLNAGTLVICLIILIIPSTMVTKIAPVKAIGFK